MTEIRAWLALTQHIVLLCRSGQLRFRMETFGLYYPTFPYSSPWWRVSLDTSLLLLQQLRSYAHWLVEMQAIRRGGGEAWWSLDARRGGSGT